MTKEFKHYNLVYYCIGWNFDGPIYTVHCINKSKGSKPPTGKDVTPVMSWHRSNQIFKHEHNN